MVTSGMKVLRVFSYICMFLTFSVMLFYNESIYIFVDDMRSLFILLVFCALFALPFFIFMKKPYSHLLYYGGQCLMFLMYLVTFRNSASGFIPLIVVSLGIFIISLCEYIKPEFKLSQKTKKNVGRIAKCVITLLYVLGDFYAVIIVVPSFILCVILKKMFRKREEDSLLDLSLFIGSLLPMAIIISIIIYILFFMVFTLGDILTLIFLVIMGGIIVAVLNVFLQQVFIYCAIKLRTPKKPEYQMIATELKIEK